MGLDVYAVETRYVDVKFANFPVNDFVEDLSWGPLGMRGLPEDVNWWEGGSGMYEYSREDLRRIASGWATSKKLSPNERRRLSRWVANLPDKDGYIMLHFSR